MRPQGDLGLVAGRHAVAAALAAAAEGTISLDRAWVCEDGGAAAWWAAHAAGLARRAGVPVVRAPRGALDRLAGGAAHQGVLVRRSAAATLDLDDLLAAAPPPALLVLVEGVEDPRNLGAIVRSAAGAGAHGVIVTARRGAGLTAGAAKAAAGTLERVKLARVGNASRALEDLSRARIWSVGLVAGAPPLWDGPDLARPTCLVVGGERAGLSRLVRERCDDLAGIPLAAGVESLNAAVAAGVALFEAARQRRATRTTARSGPDRRKG